MAEQRLDAALAARGLARSRTHAAALIAAGEVTVDGRAVVKPSQKVGDEAELAVAASDHYVSRAAHKLIAALDGFAVSPAGLVALDAGASTGGFSQVLLERGARTVLAVDVGHGQLARELIGAPGLVLVEGCNVRNLDAAEPSRGSPASTNARRSSPPISRSSRSRPCCRHFERPLVDDADFVLLVKPQFEVGRGGSARGRRPGRRAPIRGGHERALGGVRPRSPHGPASCPPQSPAATETSSTSCISARSAARIRQNGQVAVDATGRRSARVNDARHILVVSHTGRRVGARSDRRGLHPADRRRCGSRDRLRAVGRRARARP